jgi:hypothetical protein
MKTFMVQESDNKPHIFKTFLDDEEGLQIFGEHPDHYTPMKIINDYLGEEVLRIGGGGLMVFLFLPEKYMQLWSDKIGSVKDLQVSKGTGFRLDKMKKMCSR